MPRYTKVVEALPGGSPFVGPEAQERALGRPFDARIGANESVFGPSPKAQEAMRAAVAECWKYGDPENHDLKHALAEKHGVGAENIIIDEGIDGLQMLLARLLIEPGDAVVTTAGAYPTFNYHVEGFGAALTKVPFKDDREDTVALADAARKVSAKLVYLSNPDNPMGSVNSAADIQTMLEALPDGAVLCLDEAYIEFAPKEAMLAFDPEDKRLIRMRTFSKAHGMAGARIGYAVAHRDLIASFEKVRNHFAINRVAQIGALVSLQDEAWLDQVRVWVKEARERIASIAADNGLTTLPSATNFVCIDCGGDGDYAKRVVQELAKRGVFVRMPFMAPQNRCIRVSAGKPDDLDHFARAFPQALEAARS